MLWTRRAGKRAIAAYGRALSAAADLALAGLEAPGEAAPVQPLASDEISLRREAMRALWQVPPPAAPRTEVSHLLSQQSAALRHLQRGLGAVPSSGPESVAEAARQVAVLVRSALVAGVRAVESLWTIDRQDAAAPCAELPRLRAAAAVLIDSVLPDLSPGATPDLVRLLQWQTVFAQLREAMALCIQVGARVENLVAEQSLRMARHPVLSW